MFQGVTGFPRRRLILAGILGAWLACAGEPCLAEAAKVESLQVVSQDGKVHAFKVEVVDNDATRERGLMFRKHLAADAGMLFDFKEPSYEAFWMKNTYIPLDIVFIDANGRILNIARMAKPLDETNLPSAGPVLGVLEINGGEAAKLHINGGDLVRHRIFHPAGG